MISEEFMSEAAVECWSPLTSLKELETWEEKPTKTFILFNKVVDPSREEVSVSLKD